MTIVAIGRLTVAVDAPPLARCRTATAPHGHAGRFSDDVPHARLPPGAAWHLPSGRAATSPPPAASAWAGRLLGAFWIIGGATLLSLFRAGYPAGAPPAAGGDRHARRRADAAAAPGLVPTRDLRRAALRHHRRRRAGRLRGPRARGAHPARPVLAVGGAVRVRAAAGAPRAAHTQRGGAGRRTPCSWPTRSLHRRRYDAAAAAGRPVRAGAWRRWRPWPSSCSACAAT